MDTVIQDNSAQDAVPYQYTPLSGLLPLRLLTLHSAPSFTSPIQVELRSTTLHISGTEELKYLESYEALSYTWGNTERTGFIAFPNNAVLPITANLESFLRHKRETEKAVCIWIDAVCINQEDVQERNVQVGMMNMIYAAAARVTIWLGPEHSDSKAAIEELRTLAVGTPYEKIAPIDRRALTAIGSLLTREWWTRVWIVQEVYWGALGSKKNEAMVLCGWETIRWTTLVLACAKMKMNEDWWRQTFPSVENVLRLDSRIPRDRTPEHPSSEGIGDDGYMEQLLDMVVQFRGFDATDPKDKIYALRGLLTPHHPHRKLDIVVQYETDVEEIYTDFATLMLCSTRSLQLLRNCYRAEGIRITHGQLSSWVPDWTSPLPGKSLPSRGLEKKDLIPWWSVPAVSKECGKELGSITYLANQKGIRQLAEDFMDSSKTFSINKIPAWVLDIASPTIARDMLEVVQNPKCIVVSLDEGDVLTGEDIGLDEALERRITANEKTSQRNFLRQFFVEKKRTLPEYDAGAHSNSHFDIDESSRHLTVDGIIWDEIEILQDPFVDDLQSDWTNSTRLMVAIGECKRLVETNCKDQCPYKSEPARRVAFWSTIFVGQTPDDTGRVANWLPTIPGKWKTGPPPLTFLNPGQVELAQDSLILSHWGRTNFAEGGFVQVSTQGVVLEGLFPTDWNEEELSTRKAQFEELGRLWRTQPYDLYHRPFNLPYVIPDPFWECRRQNDDVAKEQSRKARQNSWVSGIMTETRSETKRARRFLMEEIKKEPAIAPQGLGNALLGEYALGRRFYITKKGHFGLGPKTAEKGDQVAIIMGVDVPFVLRELPSGEHHLIGETYVEGIMHGEALGSNSQESKMQIDAKCSIVLV